MHPYVDGVTNPRDRTFRVSCFNSRKMSPVFTGGPGVDEVPPIWIDRVGFKANISEVRFHPKKKKVIYKCDKNSFFLKFLWNKNSYLLCRASLDKANLLMEW